MLLERIRAKLRAIPALGVCRKLVYKAKGAVTREYNPICFFITYDGIAQLIALSQSLWLKAINHAVDRGMTKKCLSLKIGKFAKKQYEVKQCGKMVTYDTWCCVVNKDGCPYVLSLSPRELQDAITYGLKVSEQNPKFRINWFKLLIRKIGLFLF